MKEPTAGVMSSFPPTYPIHPARFARNTLVIALVAATASLACLKLGLEVWVMFAGFLSWFAHHSSWKEGLSGMLCMLAGLVAGALAVIGTVGLSPAIGILALPIVVIAVTLVVVGLRTVRGAKNTLAWFVGLVTFFASRLPVTSASLLELAVAGVIGGSAGLVSLFLAPGLV